MQRVQRNGVKRVQQQLGATDATLVQHLGATDATLG